MEDKYKIGQKVVYIRNRQYSVGSINRMIVDSEGISYNIDGVCGLREEHLFDNLTELKEAIRKKRLEILSDALKTADFIEKDLLELFEWVQKGDIDAEN